MITFADVERCAEAQRRVDEWLEGIVHTIYLLMRRKPELLWWITDGDMPGIGEGEI